MSALYTVSVRLTATQWNAWGQAESQPECHAPARAVHGVATCSPSCSQHMEWEGWNQMGTARAHDVPHLVSDGSGLQLQGSTTNDVMMAGGRDGPVSVQVQILPV
jgi:hypothetical protein